MPLSGCAGAWIGHQSMTIEIVWMVLRAGTLTSLGSRRRKRSRILRAPQLGFSRLTVTMAASICWATDFHNAGAPGPVREPFQSTFLVAFEDLVAGFAGDQKLAAREAIFASLSRSTKRIRPSITEHSFHGIHPPPYREKV